MVIVTRTKDSAGDDHKGGRRGGSQPANVLGRNCSEGKKIVGLIRRTRDGVRAKRLV